MQTSRVYYIYLAFFALTLFSILGLDYIQWKKGEKSYLFSVFVKKGEISVEEKSLEQVVLEASARPLYRAGPPIIKPVVSPITPELTPP